MGVKDEQNRRSQASSDNGASGFRESSQQQQYNQQQQAEPQRTANGAPSFSFSELGRRNRGILGKNPQSEILTKLTKALETLFGGGDAAFAVKLIPLDLNNNRQLPLSVLTIAVQDRQAPELGTAIHLLMLESSADPFTPIYDTINGVSIEKLRVASDAYSPDVIDAVFTEVRRAIPQGNLLDASGCVVPRGFDVEDVGLLHALAANASKACSTLLNQNHPDFVDLNLAGAEADSTLGVRTVFNQPEEADAAGQHVRSDVVIELTATSNTGNGQNAAGVVPMNRTVNISRATGFVEPVWAPAAQVIQQQNIYAPQVAQNKQCYMARFVMTGLETSELTTIPGQLLALAVAASLRENSGWFPSFLKKGRNDILAQWHDIGAVNFEANLANDPNGGSRINDTRSDGFNLPELGQLVSATFQQGLMISLDVSECGPDTWHNDVFAAAAEGNQGAYDSVIDGAQYLTNGNFSQFFPVGEAVAIDECNRIHLGYVDTKDGRRDLRQASDYLTILNLLWEKDPTKVREWSDSFNRTDFSLESRLAVRKKILVALFGDSIKFTGFARRVTFTDAFINALLQGIAATKIKIRNNTQNADMGTYERVAFNQAGVFGSGGQGANLFTSFAGGGANAAAGTGYRGNFGRWGK